MEEDKRDYKKEREDNSRKLIVDFGNLVNDGADSKALHDQYKREHRTLQQNMFREILGLICMMTKDEYRTDGRNEGSKTMAKKLIAGYAEIVKKEEKERMMDCGYKENEAEVKAEEYKQQIISDPENYLGLPHI